MFDNLTGNSKITKYPHDRTTYIASTSNHDSVTRSGKMEDQPYSSLRSSATFVRREISGAAIEIELGQK